MVTGYDHASINYNRSFVKPSEYECSDENILPLSECVHLQLIIDSLALFKNECGYVINEENVKQFDIEKLSQAYDHMISGHKFCLNEEKRKEIQTFVGDKIGKCSMLHGCHVLNNHAMRTRERTTMEHKEEEKMSE